MQAVLLKLLIGSMAHLLRVKRNMRGLTALSDVYKGGLPLRGCNILYGAPLTVPTLAEVQQYADHGATLAVFHPPESDLLACQIAKALTRYSRVHDQICLLDQFPTTPEGLVSVLKNLCLGERGFRPHIIVDNKGEISTLFEGEQKTPYFVSGLLVAICYLSWGQGATHTEFSSSYKVASVSGIQNSVVFVLCGFRS